MNATEQEVVRIRLPNGQVTIIDAADAELASGRKWQASRDNRNGAYYVKCRGVALARLIMNATKGFVVDHINGDTLDNRRCNLRVCTHQQNLWNYKRTCGKSRFKGVTYIKSNPLHLRWRARIRKDYKVTFIGQFATEEEAARAYDKAAAVMFGEFAALNFPLENAAT